MKKFDATDDQIIAILTRDARTSNREVARIVGLSETSVRKRLKRLSEAGAAKVTAVINPASVGLTVSAFVRMQTAPADARRVAEAAARLDFVSFVTLATGRFNVITLILAESDQALADMVHKHFRQWEGVHKIETIQLIGTAKHRLDLIMIQ